VKTIKTELVVLRWIIAFILAVMFMQNFETHFLHKVTILDSMETFRWIDHDGITLNQPSLPVTHTVTYLFSIEVQP
jgi:hypothetical protein